METTLNYVKALGAFIVSLPIISALYVTVAFQRESLTLLCVSLVLTLATTVVATLFCVGWFNIYRDAEMSSRRNHPTYPRVSRVRG